MTQPIFESVYLAEQPRRARLSEARDRIQDSCGVETMFGNPDMPQTAEVKSSGLVFWVQDGQQQHMLKVGANTIGRMPDNSVIINDSHVSRHHCAIILHSNGNCEVHDIASKNGTILNGQVVDKPTPMNPGDILNLSNHRIVLRAKFANVSDETPLPASV